MSKAEVTEGAPPYDAVTKEMGAKELQFSEAAGLYGDAETAERYGYVKRGSVAHIQKFTTSIRL